MQTTDMKVFRVQLEYLYALINNQKNLLCYVQHFLSAVTHVCLIAALFVFKWFQVVNCEQCHEIDFCCVYCLAYIKNISLSSKTIGKSVG